MPQYYLEKPISQFRFEDCSLELHTGHGSGQTESLYSHCSLNLGAESILSRGNVMVQVDIEQRQKGITMYFTFLYNTFQNHDLMWPWKANWRPWDKAGTFVYTRFGLTFTSVSVLAPIFRKYPLSRWWICLVSDPSPKLHSVPVWMDELNPRLRSFHQVTRILHSSTSTVPLQMALCVPYQLSLCSVTSCVVQLVLLWYLVCFVCWEGR